MASGKYRKHWSQITYHSWVKDYAHFIVPWSITLSSVRGEECPSAFQSKAHTSCSEQQITGSERNRSLSLFCSRLCFYAKLFRATLTTSTETSETFFSCSAGSGCVCTGRQCSAGAAELRRETLGAEDSALIWHAFLKIFFKLSTPYIWLNNRRGQMHKTDSWNSLPTLSHLHLSPGQKQVFRLLPLTVLQFTLQMAMGYEEWMCIKLNIQSGRVSDEPQTPTALQDRTMRAIKEKMKSRQIRTELQQAVFLDEKLLLQIASTLTFEAMLCNMQERYSLWQTMSARWAT